jgi:hypothetical protein
MLLITIARRYYIPHYCCYSNYIINFICLIIAFTYYSGSAPLYLYYYYYYYYYS